MASLDPSESLEILHLAEPAAMVRQVMAAHFVSHCRHIVEIGGHLHPVTPFLTHAPASVLVVDPKVDPFESDELNGRPCKVRHVACKFQELSDPPSGRYGLVMLGYSLKPFGARQPIGPQLYGLIDNAEIVVLEYSPELGRAAVQIPQILARPALKARCAIDFTLDDCEIRNSPFARRRMVVLEPAQVAA